jgi:lsr operon transcriptional repressor
LTQQQIAKRLHVSRATVARLLQSARAERVVEIRLLQTPRSTQRFARELERAFHLDQAVVVDAEAGTDLRSTLCRAAAGLLERMLRDGMYIGMGWGSTLSFLPDAFRPVRKAGCTVVSLVGASPSGTGRLQDVAWRVAANLDAPMYHLGAPAIVAEPPTKAALEKEDNVIRVLGMARQSSVAIVGVGIGTPEGTLARSGAISAEYAAEMQRRGAVGDILGHYFDIRGGLVSRDLDQRIVGLTFDELRALPCVMAIAGGQDKVDALRGALATGAVDTLVTDTQAALGLLRATAAANG